MMKDYENEYYKESFKEVDDALLSFESLEQLKGKLSIYMYDFNMLQMQFFYYVVM